MRKMRYRHRFAFILADDGDTQYDSLLIIAFSFLKKSPPLASLKTCGGDCFFHIDFYLQLKINIFF